MNEQRGWGHQAEDCFRIMADSAPVMVWMSGTDAACNFFNAGWLRFTGRTLAQEVGAGWADGVHADDLAACLETYAAAFAQRQPFQMEYRLRRHDGVYRWVQDTGTPRYAADGTFAGYVGACVDVTDYRDTQAQLKAALAEKDSLLGELNHRVKNVLAIVQAIARQTFRADESPQGSVADFESRLKALADSHDLLTRGHWQGASLSDVVGLELAPYASGGVCRVKLTGCNVHLGPKATVTLGMVFHELATNAAKYGALSVPTGRIQVGWSAGDVEGDKHLHVEWRESGGPQVCPPRRRGFGSTLIERCLRMEFAADVRLEFVPEGVRCHMDLPLDLISTQ